MGNPAPKTNCGPLKFATTVDEARTLFALFAHGRNMARAEVRLAFVAALLADCETPRQRNALLAGASALDVSPPAPPAAVLLPGEAVPGIDGAGDVPEELRP